MTSFSCNVALVRKGSTKIGVIVCKTREIPIFGKGQNRNFSYKIVNFS